MKIKILLLPICLALLLSGCGSKDTGVALGQGASAVPPTAETAQSGASGSSAGGISDVEYAFILWSFRDQVTNDLTYTLLDADGDGANELLVNAVTDEDNGMHTQFLADSSGTGFHFWGYTPTGAAESSNFCKMDGYDAILWNRDYSTTAYVQSHYNQWTGSAWEEIKALDGISFDYKNAAALDCPNALNTPISGEPSEILAAIDAYFENRNNANSVGEADLDGDGRTEKVYYVSGAAEDWYEALHMDNTTDNQSFREHQDIYMTVIIADETESGVVLRPVRLQYRGTNIAIKDSSLYINDEKYVYTDKDSEFSSPCLQTQLKSPGTYGDFDSQGNRTVLSMLRMPFYDISKLCTGLTFYEKFPRDVSAMFGNSRCDFEFIILPDYKAISLASPASSVKVAGWELTNNGMTIDDVPIIGDFRMGDPISELRDLMVPSTEWKPLISGQDFLVNTNFYYRPSFENEDVYLVNVWTDGEGESSKVCVISFEQIFDLEPAAEEALGLK